MVEFWSVVVDGVIEEFVEGDVVVVELELVELVLFGCWLVCDVCAVANARASIRNEMFSHIRFIRFQLLMGVASPFD